MTRGDGAPGRVRERAQQASFGGRGAKDRLTGPTRDELAGALYPAADRARGWIATRDRLGVERRHALMSLTIGGVSSRRSQVTSYADAASRADEVKAWLKSGRDAGPSLWAFDRRRGGAS